MKQGLHFNRPQHINVANGRLVFDEVAEVVAFLSTLKPSSQRGRSNRIEGP